MQGRNGVDQFSRFTMGVALVAIVLTLFTGTRNGLGAFLDILGMAALVYTYYRIFSKNIFQDFWNISHRAFMLTAQNADTPVNFKNVFLI